MGISRLTESGMEEQLLFSFLDIVNEKWGIKRPSTDIKCGKI
jgi:hypothetical protein